MNAQVKTPLHDAISARLSKPALIENYGRIDPHHYEPMLEMITFANLQPIIETAGKISNTQSDACPQLQTLVLNHLVQCRGICEENLITSRPAAQLSTSESLNHDLALIGLQVLTYLIGLTQGGMDSRALLAFIKQEMRSIAGRLWTFKDVDWNLELCGGMLPAFHLVPNGGDVELHLLVRPA